MFSVVVPTSVSEMIEVKSEGFVVCIEELDVSTGNGIL